MSKKGIIIGYLFLVVAAVGFYFLFQEKGTSISNQTNQQEELVIIEKGEGLKEIGEKLKNQGLIKSSKIFEIYAFLSQAKNKFWPGEYLLKKESGLKELLKSLTSGSLAQEKEVTIIEGLTNRQIEDILISQGLIKQGEFLTALEKLSQDEIFLNQYDFLKQIKEKILQQDGYEKFQGFLFPDTYRFYKQTTAEAIIKKMIDNFNARVDEQIKQKINQQKKTIWEITTMASLIEKEAALDQDRRLVADVFWQRLKAGWALESCATINYILGAPKTKLSFEDTRIPSPYNTYLNPGLPLGPINNPSLSSLQAAIEPLKNDYCCFLSTPEGKIIFSKTIEEHNRNKSIYLE